MIVGVQDEAFLVMTEQFTAKQGASVEAAKDLKKEILYEAGCYVRPLVGGLLHFISV
jgi:hypothetical protein